MPLPEHQRSLEARSRISRRAYFQEGSVLAERYRIEEILSVTGPGQVYKAVDLRFPETRWALKVYKGLPPETFLDEMKTQASFHHSHLVKVVDFFTASDCTCAVLEFVQGRSLEQALEETLGPLPERQVLSWGVQCADALLYLHRHTEGFPRYRNLSPRKILLSNVGELKLLPPLPSPLESASPPGVIGYAPPEAFDEAKTADERSEVYTLGAILHRCLIGGNPATIPFVFVPLDSVNPELDTNIEHVLAKATQARPEKRYANLSELRRDLLGCLRVVLRRLPGHAEKPEISPEFWWLLAAVAAAALSVWTYIFMVTGRQVF